MLAYQGRNGTEKALTSSTGPRVHPSLRDAAPRRAAAVLPGAYNGNCQSCNPSEGCRWNRDCLLGWLVGWQTSSLSQAFLYLSLWEHHSKYKNLFLLGKAGAP